MLRFSICQVNLQSYIGIVSIALREKELEFYRNYQVEIDNLIVKETANIDIMKDFKISKEIKEMLWNTDEEFNRKKKFKRIFPSPSSLNYRKFFDVERPINLFLSLRYMLTQIKIFRASKE